MNPTDKVTFETFTPKQVLDEKVREYYGFIDGVQMMFPSHAIDGAVGYVIRNNDPIMSYRVRFSNQFVFGDDGNLLVLKCGITDIVYLKPKAETAAKPTDVAIDAAAPKVTDATPDNVPAEVASETAEEEKIKRTKSKKSKNNHI